jgi:branched-chain amino acid transport system substrate-binding protein
MGRQGRRKNAGRAGAMVALAALTLVAAACSSNSSSSTTTSSGGSQTAAKVTCPINVLLVANFTGDGSSNGQANLAAVNLAIKNTNKAGGVLDCPLKLTTKDDTSDYTQDLPLVQSAVAQQSYALVMNPDFGCSTTAPYITRQGLLSIQGCSLPGVANPKYNPNSFDTDYTAARSMYALGEYLTSKGIKSMALVTDNSALGTADGSALKAAAAKGGAQVTDTEYVPDATVDYSPVVSRVKAGNPQVVVIDLFGAPVGYFLTAVTTAGWKVPIYGGSDTSATSLQALNIPLSQAKSIKLVGESSMGMPSGPPQQALIDGLQSNGVTINNFLFGYAAGSDAITLFAWGAKKAGSIDPSKITAALASSGSTKIPDLTQGLTTGYESSCHEFNGDSGLALLQGGYYNLGRLPIIEKLPAPQLPCSTPSR